ncbi:MAG TPA: hypothetical protein VFI02_10820 [Armatimonadota bacterium]|nr:hypothetical protein [Armatimonadota bacterium]
MKSEDWEKALSEVLDADAVPSKPLEEFVAACMAERHGRLSALVEWLSAPRRAVAATVAGSFALTSVLLLTILFSAKPPAGQRHAHLISPQAQMALGLGSIQKGDWENGL